MGIHTLSSPVGTHKKHQTAAEFPHEGWEGSLLQGEQAPPVPIDKILVGTVRHSTCSISMHIKLHATM